MTQPYTQLVVDPFFGEDRDFVRVLKNLAVDSREVTQARNERHTDHLWVRAPANGKPMNLFVKLYRPPLKRNLWTPLFASRARREYRNSRTARERGLNVLPAIAFGERRRAGVVVDQFVAFEDVGECVSARQMLRESGDPASVREVILPRLATGLRELHEGGCLHLAMSIRNLLFYEKDGERRDVWIDFPSAMFYSKSIHARFPALADILQVLRKKKVLPDDSSCEKFLLQYAPDDAGFRAKAMAFKRKEVRASLLRRVLKVTQFWKGL